MKLLNGHFILLSLFSFYLFFQEIRSECDDKNAVDFTAIDPANYDGNYSSITSTGKRPYGFQKATWKYNKPSQENPCVKVTGASNRRVEVLVEALPRSRLCARDQNMELECADSGTGRLFSCEPARSDTLFIEFYCDNVCGEHDVQFWYRIVLGETPDLDPEDHWCEHRSHDNYPQDLRRLPVDFDTPIETTTPLNHASSERNFFLTSPVMFAVILRLLI